MLSVNTDDFGKPINLNNEKGSLGANAMVSQYLNMKKRYKSELLKMVKGDSHGCRFYCNNDCAFVFSVEIMEALVKAIRGSDERNGCVVLFQGIRKEKKDLSFGRPTIIATAYYVNEDDELELSKVKWKKTNSLNEEEYDGFEHPGDGTGGALFLSDSEEAELFSANPPTVVKPCGEDGDTDFMIKDKLTGNDFVGWIDQ